MRIGFKWTTTALAIPSYSIIHLFDTALQKLSVYLHCLKLLAKRRVQASLLIPGFYHPVPRDSRCMQSYATTCARSHGGNLIQCYKPDSIINRTVAVWTVTKRYEALPQQLSMITVMYQCIIEPYNIHWHGSYSCQFIGMVNSYNLMSIMSNLMKGVEFDFLYYDLTNIYSINVCEVPESLMFSQIE